MYEKVVSCPICNGLEFRNEIICEDHTVSHESFAITKCNNCDFLITNPRPDQSQIGTYYQSEDYISHANKSNSPINFAYKLARNFTLKSKLKIINNLKNQGSLLDYGCGTGYFLEYCKRNNWKVEGIEPDEKTRAISSEKISQGIQNNLSSLDHKSKFDIITLWHVLEHVHELKSLLDNLQPLLKKDGYLIVAVPNVNSFDAQHYKEHWAAYDVPRHLYHFNQLTFKELSKFHGYKLVNTLPMKLDAYYVSMLSEKYKTGKNNYLKSILNGYKSNSWAKNNENNYSSLIYILQAK